MLNLDNCLSANRPCIFVVCESDIEVLKYLNENYNKSDNYSVYSNTIAHTVKLSGLLKNKFSYDDKAPSESTITVLSNILNREFHETNNHFETFVFLNADIFISDKQNIRKIKDILSRYQLDTDFTVNLIFISQTVCIPSDLERLSEVVFFNLPDENQLKKLSNDIAVKLELKKDPSDEIVNNLKGLTLFEAEQAYLQSWQLYQKIDLDFIRNFKKSAVAKTDLLSILETDITFGDIGGMETLKEWIKRSYGGWTVEGKTFGLPTLKGLLLVGLPGCGKAQPLDSIVMTPKGPDKMGNIKIGSTVCTPNGKTAKVIKIFPQGKVNIYRIYFEDGATVECCEDHLWEVTLRDRRHQADKWIVPIKYLINKIKGKDKSNNIYVETPIKVAFKKRRLKIDPYIMGLLIGDGTLGNDNDLKNERQLEITTADPEIVKKVTDYFTDIEYEVKKLRTKKYGYSIRRTLRKPFPNKYKTLLKEYGIWGKKSEDKFIPEDYLYSDHDDRVLLLKGLMDTDGDISKNGMNPCFCTSSKKLMKNFISLVESLGGYCTTTSRIPHFKDKNGIKKPGKLAYRCWVKFSNLNPFSLKRKYDRIVKRTKYEKLHRIITKIEYLGKKEAQCFAIDDVYNLYLTDNYIVTHNSLICKGIGNQWGLPVIAFDPSRVFSSRVGESEQNIRRILTIVENISPCVLFIDEIEKGFAGSQSSTFSDSGVTARVIGTFLTWMQDCTKPVFTVATSNNIRYLPPEMIQRFEETFFVSLPQHKERSDIFDIHIKKLKRDPKKFDLDAIAKASKDLSGREIEQALRGAMYQAFYTKKDLDTNIILETLNKKTSLLKTMGEQLSFLIDWVGYDEEKNDGIRARFASPPDSLDMGRVKSEIDNLLKDIDKPKG